MSAEMSAETIVNIADWLLTMQVRGLKSDKHHGHMTTGEVARRFALDKKTTRSLLEEGAEAGLIKKLEYTNGTHWRTLNPLPWEPNGKWPPGSVIEASPQIKRCSTCGSEIDGRV